jgi:hypothetical protein
VGDATVWGSLFVVSELERMLEPVEVVGER